MRWLGKTVLVIVLSAVLVPGLSGCGGSDGGDARPVATRVRVSGSGTALPLLRVLAAAQPDRTLEFVFLPGLHSGGGIEGVADGSLDVGSVSRELKPDEKAREVRVTWLSNDGLLLAAHPSVGEAGVEGLTTEQVRDIYSGKVTDWDQVGADRSLPIQVLDRHEDESAKMILREYVLGRTLKVTEEGLALYYESDMVDAIQATPGAIGYFSLGYAESQDIQVSRLELDGVAATVPNIVAGKYKVVRPLGFVMRDDASPQLRAFEAWCVSEQAQELMTDKGYAPYTK